MKAVFFARVNTKRKFAYTEFYKQDIDILEGLGFDVVLANRWREIPFDCDLYFVWWWTWAFMPLIKAKIARKPVVITGVFDLFSPTPSQCYFTRPLHQRLLMRLSLRLSNANVFVSRMEFEGVSKLLTTGGSHYVPLGVDTEKYVYRGDKREKLVLTFCLMARGNSRRKKVSEIICSVPAMLERDPAISLVIGGSKEDDYPELENLVREMHLEDSISFPGVLSEEDKIDLMHRAAVYLQPSEQEGFGLAIAEAMSCGTPVVINPVGAVPEVVGEAGTYLEGYEPEEIADKVISLLNDADHWHAMSIAGRRRIEEKYSINRRLVQMRDIIRQAIGREFPAA
ncbi:MAG: glycosyltransferase family 4 protein [Candidatus Geothermincolia bacterium]